MVDVVTFTCAWTTFFELTENLKKGTSENKGIWKNILFTAIPCEADYLVVLDDLNYGFSEKNMMALAGAREMILEKLNIWEHVYQIINFEKLYGNSYKYHKIKN